MGTRCAGVGAAAGVGASQAAHAAGGVLGTVASKGFAWIIGLIVIIVLVVVAFQSDVCKSGCMFSVGACSNLIEKEQGTRWCSPSRHILRHISPCWESKLGVCLNFGHGLCLPARAVTKTETTAASKAEETAAFWLHYWAK